MTITEPALTPAALPTRLNAAAGQSVTLPDDTLALVPLATAR